METHSLNKLITNIQQSILKAMATLKDNGLEKTPANKELGELYKRVSTLNPIEKSLKRDKPTPKDKPTPQAQTLKQEDVTVPASASPSVMSKAAELAKKTKTNVSIVEGKTLTVGEFKKMMNF